MFACNLYRQGAMGERDYRTYDELYHVLTEFLPPPDLIVYLRASVDTLLMRIALRGRDYEKNISREYLTRLNELYEEWVARFTRAPILCVPPTVLTLSGTKVTWSWYCGKFKRGWTGIRWCCLNRATEDERRTAEDG